jgi:hypothetical protein
MYPLNDPLDAADHVMPWRHIIIAALYGGGSVVLLSPIVSLLWLL